MCHLYCSVAIFLFIYSQQDQATSNQGSGSWLEGMNSPLIQQDGDCKQLKLRFDVSQYKPEEIVVKTVDNKLLVCSTICSIKAFFLFILAYMRLVIGISENTNQLL